LAIRSQDKTSSKTTSKSENSHRARAMKRSKPKGNRKAESGAAKRGRKWAGSAARCTLSGPLIRCRGPSPTLSRAGFTPRSKPERLRTSCPSLSGASRRVVCGSGMQHHAVPQQAGLSTLVPVATFCPPLNQALIYPDRLLMLADAVMMGNSGMCYGR
jgi:hypothetical protein